MAGLFVGILCIFYGLLAIRYADKFNERASTIEHTALTSILIGVGAIIGSTVTLLTH
jgi:hypothetical protein